MPATRKNSNSSVLWKKNSIIILTSFLIKIKKKLLNSQKLKFIDTKKNTLHPDITKYYCRTKHNLYNVQSIFYFPSIYYINYASTAALQLNLLLFINTFISFHFALSSYIAIIYFVIPALYTCNRTSYVTIR